MLCTTVVLSHVHTVTTIVHSPNQRMDGNNYTYLPRRPVLPVPKVPTVLPFLTLRAAGAGEGAAAAAAAALFRILGVIIAPGSLLLLLLLLLVLLVLLELERLPPRPCNRDIPLAYERLAAAAAPSILSFSRKEKEDEAATRTGVPRCEMLAPMTLLVLGACAVGRGAEKFLLGVESTCACACETGEAAATVPVTRRGVVDGLMDRIGVLA
jgi:hypothetical protein